MGTPGAPQLCAPLRLLSRTLYDMSMAKSPYMSGCWCTVLLLWRSWAAIGKPTQCRSCCRTLGRARSMPQAHCACSATEGVKRLAKLGMVAEAPGMAALDMNSAEDAIVQHTREVVDGMVICGMEVRCMQLPCQSRAVAYCRHAASLGGGALVI